MGRVRELGLCAAAVALLGSGCGGNTYESTPIDFAITMRPSDVEQDASTVSQGSALDADASEYPSFIGHVRDAFGDDPSRLEITSATLSLTANHNLNSLDKVFAKGKVAVVFHLDGSDTDYQVAEIDDPTGTDAALTLDFQPDQLSGGDRKALIDGHASVVVRGPMASFFARSSGEADLDVSFTFKAYR
jgi:hypothetical protein